ncbi:acetyl-CoA carboxylase biotin carboxyl carrier protein [Helicobacter ailurogastricus]|uniref:Biotin carboxyl carrier protein of acetyl-CoA carboxylase n=3 Tax=Helicobacter ailurogastricus TaxID=1578720 RepID=A0A0K2XA66_9HELI|nr:acetyl-CoA carboxylase biotin carboxyl carrier protein [Helicobacter ailurogastricus]CRF41721.1 Biotin carboxyl carrier protein of acetyl-CoA carboxylase [Helicobacter ailurogastricus]CRF42443.1 Biotin carboxyl carrier protein of acetyl-CoA carboxylase [Helicobacter ailurogastricus]CRF43859.1 Biotin carboxyl carrier protein of acetyl-CoA carboxylase [Helicobacter ailurogastricus]CRF52883.1 Biotin carboxyl carrier protein of acetyl-CoA carboxylase [Helicobacter ailurogastricus]BDQ28351.1 ace
MHVSDIQELMASFDKSQINYFKLKMESVELVLDKSGKRNVVVAEAAPLVPLQTPTANACAINATAATTSAGQQTKEDYILSPMVGTFYHRPSPTASPYVQVGDTIKKGQVIGIVEAMKIMNEIEAECDCKILAIEVDDATAVEYGTQLVKIQKL